MRYLYLVCRPGMALSAAAAARRGWPLLMKGCLLWVQGKVGEAKLGQLCSEGELHVGKFLASDPEFDPADMLDVPAFLKQEGLSAVPL